MSSDIKNAKNYLMENFESFQILDQKIREVNTALNTQRRRRDLAQKLGDNIFIFLGLSIIMIENQRESIRYFPYYVSNTGKQASSLIICLNSKSETDKINRTCQYLEKYLSPKINGKMTFQLCLDLLKIEHQHILTAIDKFTIETMRKTSPTESQYYCVSLIHCLFNPFLKRMVVLDLFRKEEMEPYIYPPNTTVLNLNYEDIKWLKENIKFKID